MLGLATMSFKRASAAALFVASLGLALAPSSCRTSCSDNASDEDEVWEGGIVDREQGVYQSGPWNGPWLEFKPQKTYTFPHGLGGEPRILQAYVGFQREPLGPDRNTSEAAGNVAIWEQVDKDVVVVRNDTCQKFYLNVVLANPASADAAGDENSAGQANGTGGGTSVGGAASE